MGRRLVRLSTLLLALAVTCLLFMALNLVRGELLNAVSDAFVAVCLLFVRNRSETGPRDSQTQPERRR
jgi:hypothetical protein